MTLVDLLNKQKCGQLTNVIEVTQGVIEVIEVTQDVIEVTQDVIKVIEVIEVM